MRLQVSLTTPSDVDRDVRRWLRQAYRKTADPAQAVGDAPLGSGRRLRRAHARWIATSQALSHFDTPGWPATFVLASGAAVQLEPISEARPSSGQQCFNESGGWTTTGRVHQFTPLIVLQRRAAIIALPMAFAMAACSQPARTAAASEPRRSSVTKAPTPTLALAASPLTLKWRPRAAQAIGVSFSSSFLNALPASHSDQHHCSDRNKDGKGIGRLNATCGTNGLSPCPLMQRVDRNAVQMGVSQLESDGSHSTRGVHLPIFDVDFYLEPIRACLPSRREPAARSSSGAISSTWRKNPSRATTFIPITRTWTPSRRPWETIHRPHRAGIQWPALRSLLDLRDLRRLDTYYEEMLSRDHLLSKPDSDPIKTAAAVDQTGDYPTMSCVRYDARATRTPYPWRTSCSASAATQGRPRCLPQHRRPPVAQRSGRDRKAPESSDVFSVKAVEAVSTPPFQRGRRSLRLRCSWSFFLSALR